MKTIKTHIMIILTIILFLVDSPAQAQTPSGHVIVVVENSGTALRSNSDDAKVEFYNTRFRFFGSIANLYDRNTLITFISVSRPRVIWSGISQDLGNKRKNQTLIRFLDSDFGGCADYTSVSKRVLQQKRQHSSIPVIEVVFFATLLHTGPSPCAENFDRANPAPPDKFYEDMALLADDSSTKFRFLWADERSFDKTFEFFLEKQHPADVKAFDETLQELGG